MRAKINNRVVWRTASVAQYLGVSKGRVYQLGAEGRLKKAYTGLWYADSAVAYARERILKKARM